MVRVVPSPVIYMPQLFWELSVRRPLPVIVVSYLPQRIVEPDEESDELPATFIVRLFMPAFLITESPLYE